MKKRGKTGILNAVRSPGEGAEKTEIKSGKGCVCVLLQKLQRFMMGRYGGDKFSIFLLVSGLVLTILGQIFFWPVILLGDALYLYALFRMFSRNIPARQREYYAFLKVWTPVADWFRFQKRKFSDRKTFRYFRCPNCGQQLRVPRGKGTITVTCRSCGASFQEKS